MRECGMLLPVASLPSRYGIGAFSKEAYDFIDTLKAAGQSFWQILPLGPTGFGDSPYQPFRPLREILILLIWKSWQRKDFSQGRSAWTRTLETMRETLIIRRYTMVDSRF